MWMFRKDKSYSIYNFKVLIQRCVTCIYQRLVSGSTTGQRPLVACSWTFLPSPHCLSLKDMWCCCKTGPGRNLWAGEKWEKIHIKKKEGSSGRGRGRGRESTLVNNCTKLLHFFLLRAKKAQVVMVELQSLPGLKGQLVDSLKNSHISSIGYVIG